MTAIAASIGFAALAAATLAGPAAAAPGDSSVAAGYAHTCAIRACRSSASRAYVPTATSWNTVFTLASIDAGTTYNCAVRTDGTLWCWGSNRRGQLGDGTTTNRATPVQVGTGTTWASVSAGDSHTCATRTDGTLWCWGFNRLGQMGTGTSIYYSTTPVQVGTATTWASVTTG